MKPLKIKYTDPSNLKPWAKNPRRELSEPERERLFESVKKFGHWRPLHCRTDGTLIAGHKRLETLAGLTAKERAEITGDAQGRIPVIYHDVTDAEAAALAVQHNQDWGGFEMPDLAGLLDDLPEIDQTLLGFGDGELEALGVADVDLGEGTIEQSPDMRKCVVFLPSENYLGAMRELEAVVERYEGVVVR